MFYQAVFELIDNWCTSVDAAEYLNLLDKLEARVRALAAVGHWTTPDTVTVEDVPHASVVSTSRPPVTGTGTGLSAQPLQPAASVHCAAGVTPIQVKECDNHDCRQDAAAPATITPTHNDTLSAVPVAAMDMSLRQHRGDSQTDGSASARLWQSTGTSSSLVQADQDPALAHSASCSAVLALAHRSIRYAFV